jgi:hypothetical protein
MEYSDAERSVVAAIGSEAATAGYEHPGYAASLSEFGALTLLPRSGGWALRRPIAGSSQGDLIGPYPLFFCKDWSRLPHDLADLAGKAVSFSMVTDPFANLDFEFLKSSFEVVLPFKEHFVAELSWPIKTIVSKSHQENVRRALKKIEVFQCPDPPAVLSEWVRLYGILAKRHGIRGIRAFSEPAFSQQLAIPGMVAFEGREIATGDIVGMELWYLQSDIAYGHLAAFSDRGYELRASYAMKWYVLNYFSDKAHYLHLGAGAGASADVSADNGLAKFKRGWSTGTRTNYFCGKILDPAAYTKLARDKNAVGLSFFPAYRQGQF